MKHVAVLLLMLAAACSSSTEPSASVTGSYTLSTVDGAALPATVNVNGFNLTFTSGTLTLGSGTYTWFTCELSPGAGSACGAGYDRLTETGTWSMAGGSPRFVGQAGDTTQTSAMGNTITFRYGLNGASTFVFTKQ